MPNLNKVILMGNLTRDPELGRTPSDTAVCRVGLAINRNYTDASGQKQKDTTFVDAEAWGRTGEVIAQYLHKGEPILVEGRLKLDQWQDKDGANRSKLKVVIEQFEFISSRAQDEGGRQGQTFEPQGRSAPTTRPQMAMSGR